MIRRLLVAALAVVALATLGYWLVVHDEVAKVRELAKSAQPPPPLVKSVFLASEGPLLERTPAGLRGLNCLRPRVVCCVATLANRVARQVCPHRVRMIRWHLENILVSDALARTFTPEELLAVHLSEAGVESSARAYFGKPAAELSLEEAATVVASLRAPAYYRRHPEKLAERRNRLLRQMKPHP